MNQFDRAYQMITWLVNAAGGEVQSASALLRRGNRESFTSADLDRMRPIKEAGFNGFFHMAAKNQVFCDLERISQYYGRTVQAAYPACTATFYQLTNTYFTFKVELIAVDGEPSLCAGLLRGIDFDFSSVFYPTPGPLRARS
jgi:hypothetical protein